MRILLRTLATAFASLVAAVAAPRSAHADPGCEVRTFESGTFTVCTFDSRHMDLLLAWTDSRGAALRSFAKLRRSLGPQAGRVRFAMNAGMYEDTGMPLGLFVEHSVQRRPLNIRSGDGNFYMKPNGVFSQEQNGTLKITTTEQFAADRIMPPVWATQSGPMLVIDGALHPQVSKDGPSKNIRNGVGILNAHTALFVISDTPVSFGLLARFFRDGLHCGNALYFDGAISSAWIPARKRQDQGAQLGPMVVAIEKP